MVEELDKLGLLRDSEGAKCVFPQGFVNRDGDPLPLIVRKRDGGYGYASTDLATIRHRLRDLGATRLLYAVGLPQRLHREMTFQAAREAGWLVPPATAEHVGFGSVLGKDGKLLRSRAGESVKLVDLIDEAVRRAEAAVAEKNPSLAEFYRELLGLQYRPGDEPPAPGEPDPRGQDWLVLRDAAGNRRLAFQQVAELPRATWPEGPIAQQLHLDLTVPTPAELDVQHERALALGARLLLDRSDDPEEPLRVLRGSRRAPVLHLLGDPGLIPPVRR